VIPYGTPVPVSVRHAFELLYSVYFIFTLCMSYCCVDICSVKGDWWQAVCQHGVSWADNTGEYRQRCDVGELQTWRLLQRHNPAVHKVTRHH